MNILSGRRERKKTLWVGGTLMHSLNWGRGVQRLCVFVVALYCGGSMDGLFLWLVGVFSFSGIFS
eukprot:scaffold24406_cov103-Skeletonema_marinoi.AAC.2